jgi:hypothetical protein
MTMPATDEQEATLHAQLAGNFDEYVRLLDSLDPAAARTGYSALVSAASPRRPRSASPSLPPGGTAGHYAAPG